MYITEEFISGNIVITSYRLIIHFIANYVDNL